MIRGYSQPTGYIQRRQGRWEESIRNLERAIELDPRNLNTLDQIGDSYGMARRYAEQKSKLDRMLTIAPNDVAVKAERAFVEVDWKADTGPLHQLIDEIRATNPAAMPKIAASMAALRTGRTRRRCRQRRLARVRRIPVRQTTLLISRVLSSKALSRA